MRVPINLDLGCDFHLTYDNIENATRNPSTYTINGGTCSWSSPNSGFIS